MTENKKYKLWLPVLGFFLSLGVMVSYFLYFVYNENIRDHPLWLIIVNFLVAIATLWAASKIWQNKEKTFLYKITGLSFAILALAPPIFFVFFVSYLSHQVPDKKEAVQSENFAPAISLADSSGEIVKLSDYKGRNVVLVFYRGYW